MEEADHRLVALEGLIHNNPDLERLETLAGQFNPFTAMGWTRQEIRHSAFLRWFLDPAASHGLGSYPLRVFLKEIMANGSGSPTAPTIFDADTWDLSGSVVLTEWERIDVLVRNDEERFVVVLENKVHSAEHSQQLQRYRQIVERTFPEHSKAYVFLTPGGDPPSDDAYQALAYSTIGELVARVVGRKRLQLSDEVRTFLEQYVDLVRRHIVEDSEIQELCKRLYEKHRVALDLIYEHRPDRVLEVSRLLTLAIQGNEKLILDSSTKTYIRFTTPELDGLPKRGEGWKSGRFVLFEFENYGEKVTLKLMLGPAPDELRSVVTEAIVARPDLYNRSKSRIGSKWWCSHRLAWLSKKTYAEKPLDELEDDLKSKMSQIVEDEVLTLQAPLALLVDELNRLSGDEPGAV